MNVCGLPHGQHRLRRPPIFFYRSACPSTITAGQAVQSITAPKLPRCASRPLGYVSRRGKTASIVSKSSAAKQGTYPARRVAYCILSSVENEDSFSTEVTLLLQPPSQRLTAAKKQPGLPRLFSSFRMLQDLAAQNPATLAFPIPESTHATRRRSRANPTFLCPHRPCKINYRAYNPMLRHRTVPQ